MESLNHKITEHIRNNPNESRRCMSGFVSALPYTADEIRLALDQMVERGTLERYGNGKRHCWRLSGG